MASPCGKRGSGWKSGRITSLKGLLSIGTGCPGRLWSHHPWRCKRNDWMWCSVPWSGLQGGDQLKIGLYAWKSFSTLAILAHPLHTLLLRIQRKGKTINRYLYKSVHSSSVFCRSQYVSSFKRTLAQECNLISCDHGSFWAKIFITLTPFRLHLHQSSYLQQPQKLTLAISKKNCISQARGVSKTLLK